jgi:acetyltransferase-like isoleucine patch superfamily enzyme
MQRYLVPGFVASIYYFLRFRCAVSPKAKVQLTRRIRFGKATVVKPFAAIQTGGGEVRIGKKVSVNNFCQIATGAEGDISLGDYTRLGPHVVIGGTRRRFAKKDVLIIEQGHTSRGVRIGNDVMIGAGASLFECNVGDGAVIGAGSVVTRDVAPYTVVVGVPAKVVAERT